MRVQPKNLLRTLLAALLSAAALKLPAQGTAFSYQGRLYDSGSPANTNYDFRFAVYDAVTNGTRLSGFVTNAAVRVSTGLFNVALNFGPGVFNGTDNGSNDFLDIAVRATNVTAFTPLLPRQPILPVPYAMFASSASNLLGKLPSAVFSGNYSNAVNFPNATNTFTGAFSGSGSNLVNLNAANISSGTLADARLSLNVPLLNASQTFTGSNVFSSGTALTGPNTLTGPNAINGPTTVTGAGTFTGANFFSGVNTFTNLGNTFSGNFFGNGLVGWIVTNGTTVQAQFDRGYLLTSPTLATVKLPTSVSVGDIVRVSGGGGGGWRVTENSGQSIIGNFASFSNGIVRMLSSGDDASVAASADGVRIFVVGSGINGVAVTTDGGRSWGSAGNLNNGWSSVACSANGKIVYAQPTAGHILKSVDGGATWPTDTGTNATGGVIACTADGSTLLLGVACSGNGNYRARINAGAVQVWNNTSSTWTSVSNPSGTANAACVAASSDCTKLVAAVSNGLLYASANMGASWTSLNTSTQAWSGLWMSPDGSKFAATVATTGVTGSINFCDVSPLPNTSTTTSTGNLCGSQGSAVELQCIATGVFMPVSSTGLIWAN